MSAPIKIDTITQAISQLSSKPTPNYLDHLTQTIASLTPFEMVFVGRFDELDRPTKVTTVSGFSKITPWKNITYNLIHTPCESLAANDVCFYEDRVSEIFPKDQMLSDFAFRSYFGVRFRNLLGEPVGIFSGLSTRPVSRAPELDHLFLVFAKRVGLELEMLDTSSKKFIQTIYTPSVDEVDQLIRNREFSRLAGELAGESLGKRRQVLCIDDEPEILELIASSLEDEGFSVTASTNPVWALQLLKKDPTRYSAIVTDIKMPLMDGTDLIKESMKLSETLPFVVISGHIDHNDLEVTGLNSSRLAIVEKVRCLSVPKAVLSLLSAKGET